MFDAENDERVRLGSLLYRCLNVVLFEAIGFDGNHR